MYFLRHGRWNQPGHETTDAGVYTVDYPARIDELIQQRPGGGDALADFRRKLDLHGRFPSRRGQGIDSQAGTIWNQAFSGQANVIWHHASSPDYLAQVFW